jgi:hypothetical protein
VKGNQGAAFVGSCPNLDFDGTVEGNGSNQRLPNRPFGATPELVVAAPAEAKVGEKVRFAVAGELEHVLWDLGDGIPETAASVEHVYGRAGEYHVVVMGWSRDGMAGVAERRVRVVP